MTQKEAENIAIVFMTIIRTLGQAFAFWVVLPLWAFAAGLEFTKE